MKRPERNKFVLNEDNKRKSDRHPTHKGVLDVEGRLYWIGGYLNESQYGMYFKGDVRPVSDEDLERYFSEGNKPKISAPAISQPKQAKPVPIIDDNWDDELPF